MTQIILDNISVRLSKQQLFATKEVLSDISFSLNEGDRLALIGANGAGKSTLLYSISKILHPHKGSIEVDGQVSALFHLSVGQRAQLSGRRNMVIRNLLAGHPYDEIVKRLPEMIEFADIGDAIDDPMETYSQGMAMRVVFAAATAFHPDILLMDEWLGVGDAAFRDKSATRMDQLVENSGIIVLATHHQRLSRERCNLGAFLEQGRLKFFGDINECWDHYLEQSRN